MKTQANAADPNHQALPVRRSGKRSQAYSRMSRYRSNLLTDVQESRNGGGCESPNAGDCRKGRTTGPEPPVNHSE